MTVDPREHVRAQHTCVACDGSKSAGLLLCWQCHHRQKKQHDGGYSAKIEGKLDALELSLKTLARAGIGQTEAQ